MLSSHCSKRSKYVREHNISTQEIGCLGILDAEMDASGFGYRLALLVPVQVGIQMPFISTCMCTSEVHVRQRRTQTYIPLFRNLVGAGEFELAVVYVLNVDHCQNLSKRRVSRLCMMEEMCLSGYQQTSASRFVTHTAVHIRL